MKPPQQTVTVVIDLVDCCITQNYWDHLLAHYWAQALPDYLHNRWSLEDVQRTLQHLGYALSIPPEADQITYYEQLTQCIRKDQWPKGLSVFLSQLTLIGVDSGYLEPQTHADTHTSLKRWREKGWKTIVAHELSTAAQDRLLEKAQYKQLINELSGRVSLDTTDNANSLLLYENVGKPSAAHVIISARTHILDWGERNGYRPIRLNRHLSQDQPMEKIPHIIDLNFVDLILG